MKNTHHTVRNRCFRRWACQLLAGWIKRQDRDYLKEILEKLQEMEESIEIIAREISRQAKRGQ